MKPTPLILALALAGAAPAAGADIFRWTDEQGRVHYGDRPSSAPRGQDWRPDLLDASGNAAAGLPPEAIDAARERARQRSQALAATHQSVVEAERAYATARERLERESEPRPGERLGLAGGGSRLSPAYFQRLAALEADVARARARLDQALASRNALR